MKIEDVRVGMRLRNLFADHPAYSPITVTELTERGFKYSISRPVVLHHRYGWVMQQHGHEAYANESGEVHYELLSEETLSPLQSIGG